MENEDQIEYLKEELQSFKELYYQYIFDIHSKISELEKEVKRWSHLYLTTIRPRK